MSASKLPSPAILRNKGLPVEVHVVEQEDGRWVRQFNGDDPKKVLRWVSMNMDVLSSLEEEPPLGWGSVENWQQSLSDKPLLTLCRTLALIWDLWTPQGVPDRRLAGLMLVDGETDQYSTAVGGAFMLANGVDPERVGEALAVGVKSATRVKAQFKKLAEESIQEMEILEAKEAELSESGGSLPSSSGGDASTLTSPGVKTSSRSGSGSRNGASSGDQ